MALSNTTKTMRELLQNITTDLEKAENGNKAASQRVRTGTIRLEKTAKVYRKESISAEKKGLVKRKPSAKAKSSSKKHDTKAKSTQKAKKTTSKASSKSSKKMVRPHALTVRRATAKLPRARA